jgi:hypothetical protein
LPQCLLEKDKKLQPSRKGENLISYNLILTSKERKFFILGSNGILITNSTGKEHRLHRGNITDEYNMYTESDRLSLHISKGRFSSD